MDGQAALFIGCITRLERGSILFTMSLYSVELFQRETSEVLQVFYGSHYSKSSIS